MPIKNWTVEKRKKYNASKMRWLAKKKGYGITPEKFEEYCIGLNFICEICGIQCENTHHSKLQIDHDHEHHIFRGALCGSCNRGLGVFKDSLELLLKAAAYLEKKNVDRNGHQSVRR